MRDELKRQAEKAKVLYYNGHITREEAKTQIMPYINAVNERSKDLAKKYNQRPKLVNFAGFMR